jgi:hypothetical protein
MARVLRVFSKAALIVHTGWWAVSLSADRQ